MSLPSPLLPWVKVTLGVLGYWQSVTVGLFSYILNFILYLRYTDFDNRLPRRSPRVQNQLTVTSRTRFPGSGGGLQNESSTSRPRDRVRRAAGAAARSWTSDKQREREPDGRPRTGTRQTPLPCTSHMANTRDALSRAEYTRSRFSVLPDRSQRAREG